MSAACAPTSGDAVLARALDTTVMGRLFARQLAEGVELADCRVARYRRRPGRRCFVQYAVRVRFADGAERQDRVTAQWHEDHARATTIYRTLERRRQEVGEWSAPFPPAFLDAETGMVATTFPFDRRLPGLPAVVAGRDRDLLDPVLAWMGAPGSAGVHCEVETARYREQLSAVCRYTVRATPAGRVAGSARFFVKVYADDEGARLEAALGAMSAACQLDPGAALVDPAVAYVPRLRALVLNEAQGSPLDSLLADPADAASIERRLQRAATALVRFGHLPVPGDSLKAPRDTVGAAERSLAAIASAAPLASSRCERLALVRVGAAARESLVHGDLKLEHVFDDGRRVRLIDMDSAHRGDARWDRALLTARWWVAADAVVLPRGLADWGAAVIGRAFDTLDPQSQRRGFAELQALALLDVAAGMAKRREPEWEMRVERTLDRALAALTGAES